MTDAVYSALKIDIIEGRAPPGHRLRETELARAFGTSSTPVREALARLSRDGLVRIEPWRGATVTAWSPDELSDLYDIREILESRAAGLATTRATAEGLQRLHEILDGAAAVLNQEDQVAFNRLDLEFHRALNLMSGNSQLAELATSLHHRIMSMRTQLVHLPVWPSRSHAGHVAIYEAVAAGDVERSEQLVTNHIRDVRSAVLAALKESSVESAS